MAAIARNVLKRPLTIFLGLSLLLPLAAYFALQIDFEDGTREIFASSHPHYAAYQEHVRRYPQSDTDIFVIASSKEAFDRRQLESLRDYVLDLQLLEGVEFAASVFSQQERNGETGEWQTLIADDLGSYDDISAPLRMARDSEWAPTPLINKELNQTIVIFSVDDGFTDVARFDGFVGKIEALNRELEISGDMQLSMTGMLPIRHHIVNRLRSEQLYLNIVGAILGALVAFFLFRSVTLGFMNGIAPANALFLTFGAFGLLGITMNVITNSVTVLIMALAMADCIHMTHELRKNASKGMGRDAAIKGMLMDIGPPCMLAGLTTILALASLFYSGSELIRSFATAGIVGIVMAMFAVLVIHPLVFALGWKFGFVRRVLEKPAPKRVSAPIMLSRVTNMLVGKRYVVTTGGLVVAALALSAFLPIQTNHYFNQYLLEDSPIRESLKQVEEIAGPSATLDVILRPENGGELLSAENQEALGNAHEALAARFPGNPIISLHSLRQKLNPDDTPAGEAAMSELLDFLPERARAELLGWDENGFKIAMRIGDLPSAEIRELGRGIEAELSKLGDGPLAAEEINGLSALAAYRSDDMIRELTISFLIAAFVCPLLVGLWFREWRYSIAAILPNILPILLVGGWLMWSGTHLHFTSAIALSVAFGIAVDDTIHVLNRVQIERRRKGSPLAFSDLPAVMNHVAPALITTTCILSFGLSSALFSEMPTATFFGLLCVSIFVLALLADLLLLLPAVAILYPERVSARSGRAQR